MTRPKRRYLHRVVLPFLAGLLLTGLLQVARGAPLPPSPASASTSRQKKDPKSHKTSSGRTAVIRTSSRKRSSSKKKKNAGSQRRRKQSSLPVRKQSHPTAQRYTEIQTALAKAGYLQGPANGVWGQSSVSALANFQKDNGLEPTGKIDAQSLIKLDLGPKYDSKTVSTSAGAASHE